MLHLLEPPALTWEMAGHGPDADVIVGEILVADNTTAGVGDPSLLDLQYRVWNGLAWPG